MDYETAVKAETILEMKDRFLKTVIDVMKMHGDDKTGLPMISASIVMFVQELDRSIHPGFSLIVSEQLISDVRKRKDNG
jgi:hypothetical protein